MPGKLDPGEGVIGTGVFKGLQEPLKAPGASLTLPSVLFGRGKSERPRRLKGQSGNKTDTFETVSILT